MSTPTSNDPRTLALTVAYDGTDFQGFQRLTAGRSVQATIEETWRAVTGKPVRIVGAGRTDAGVHATGQVVSLRTESGLPTDRVALALNAHLPKDVRIRKVRERGEEFHARFSATERTYIYVVRRKGRPSVFWDRYSLLLTGPLSLERMRETAGLLEGSHDFRSFGSPEPGKHGTRDLRRVRFKEFGPWLFISLSANAFLKGMARTLVAQILAVGRGDVEPQDIEGRLLACNRGVAGKSAPPNGLYLARVRYTGDRCRVSGVCADTRHRTPGTWNLETP